MSEVKSIAVLYLPKEYTEHYGNKRNIGPGEYMAALNGGYGDKSDNRIQHTDYWKDYYWLVFVDYEIERPELKVFHPKDFTDIQYKELEAMVLKSLEELSKKPTP